MAGNRGDGLSAAAVIKIIEDDAFAGREMYASGRDQRVMSRGIPSPRHSFRIQVVIPNLI
jgi:hypothetical protein